MLLGHVPNFQEWTDNAKDVMAYKVSHIYMFRMLRQIFAMQLAA